tara:strand:- start:35 stop:187 length:153 start_codon:yes stop_codon:yes gene_type:complete
MMDVVLVRQFEFEFVSELYLLWALKLNTAPTGLVQKMLEKRYEQFAQDCG